MLVFTPRPSASCVIAIATLPRTTDDDKKSYRDILVDYLCGIYKQSLKTPSTNATIPISFVIQTKSNIKVTLKTEQSDQFILFLVVGSINTLFGYGGFTLLTRLNIHYTIAILISTCIGMLFNFRTIGTIVFKNTGKNLILRFIGVYTIIYFVNITIIKVINYFVENIFISGAIAAMIAATLSYLLNKHLVFREANNPCKPLAL